MLYAWRKNLVDIVLDSKVDDKPDAKKPGSKSEAMVNEQCWDELSKKAEKASDADIAMLTSSLEKSWIDVSTLTKFACTETKAAQSTLEKLADKGVVKIDAAIKTAYKVGEMTYNAAKKKIGEVGANLLSWVYGGNKTSENQKPAAQAKSTTQAAPAGQAKPADNRRSAPAAAQTNKPETASTEQKPDGKPIDAGSDGLVTQVLQDMAPAALKNIYNAVFNDKEKSGSALAVIPAAIINPQEFVFKMAAAAISGALAEANVSNDQAAVDSKAVEQPASDRNQSSPQAANETDAPDTPREISTRTQSPPATDSEMTIEQDRIVYRAKDETGRDVLIERASDGTINATVAGTNGQPPGELRSDQQGNRIYTAGGRERYRHMGPGRFRIGEFAGDNGKLEQVQNGRTLLTATSEQIADVYENLVFFHSRTADNLIDALEQLKKERPDLGPENTFLVKYKNGTALVHPALERVLEFRNTEQGIEFYYDLGEGKQLWRSPEGKLFIVSDDGQSVKELSEDQKKDVLEGLGAKSALIRHLLETIGPGKAIRLPEGQEISFDDDDESASTDELAARATEAATRIRFTRAGWQISDLTRKTSFNEQTGELTSETQGGDKITFNINTATLDFTTDGIQRVDGVTTMLDTGVVIHNDGTVDLPDGSTISKNNDLFFSNGSAIMRDGTLVASDGTVITALNVPHKANLDSFVSKAVGLASSIAARASGGNASVSDLYLIEANMSVVQSYINVFSILGNMPMANSLFRSWSMLKDSHAKTQHTVDERQLREREEECQVQVFLSNLQSEALQAQKISFEPSNNQPYKSPETVSILASTIK